MKATEILQKAYDLILEKQSSAHEIVDPILIDTLKEYAHIQIGEYREQIIALINDYESGMSSEFIIGKIKEAEIKLN